MPRQFVSICGHSAAGKKTLIQKLLDNDPPGLRERFNITGSVRAYGFLKGLGQVSHMVQSSVDTILHFWQDNSHPWVAYLKETFPHDTHRVILLWRPWESHSAALLARKTPEYEPTPLDVARNWHRHMVPLFKTLEAKGFDIELFNGETYEPLEGWPH